MGGGGIPKNGALCHEKASKRRIGLKEGGFVNRENVNAGGFGDVLGKATSVLGANFGAGVLERR